MGKWQKISFIFLVLILFDVHAGLSSESEIAPAVFIAHAGGGINQKTYTNSLEALNSNYEKGFRFFEIDFSWTSDGELVAIHDWNESVRRRFDVDGSEIRVLTKADFLKLKSRDQLTQLTMEHILRWAAEKGDAYIVTDVKEDNIKALKQIKLKHNEFKKYIIPQTYNYDEYDDAIRLGFGKVILTLYRMKTDPVDVVKFCIENSPFAITMHWEVAETGLAYFLSRNNTTVYAHTVNDLKHFQSLRKIGVFGIYTDFLVPP
jgi:glycerophosphoryl diester phosphodiesterase